MTPISRSALAAALILTAGPALADPPRTTPTQGSSYGQFLAGRFALNTGDGENASRYLASALAGSSGEQLTRERAFSAALLAGDVERAAAVPLDPAQSQPALVEAGRLAQAVQALIDGRARTAYRELEQQPIGAPHGRAGALVARWLAAEAGDWDAALAEPSPTADALTQIFTSYHRAQLLERRRRFDEAEALYRQLLMDGNAAPLFRLPYGEFLERRRRPADAIAVYDGGLALGTDRALVAARERAASRSPAPPLPTIRQSAADALYQAASAAIVSRGYEYAVTYLGFALALDPNEGDAWLALGQSLHEIGLQSAARDAWARTPPETAAYAEAQVQLALSLEEAGEGAEAVRVAREAAGLGVAEAATAFTLAGLLNSQERYAEALEVLDGPALADLNTDWRVMFLRGAAHERLGEHAQAEAAFQQALVLEPNSPEILNYLGYLWIDRGERVDEGIAMVERAVAADPDNGAYVDSLGWGRYRQGRMAEAVTLLERAVTLDSSSATINDHLGDAYWRVGREREARYQWRRVLTLEPDSDLRRAAEAKLALGLDPVMASAGEP
ncbi:tetratricopeptide repeat protein [Brevundimonas sp.]|uniref:tetratricopeptide repeat protein n=1 Tax=Brevundimonas sp. TaxID=1871086 RepID=UPI0025E02416|nr:tetratricopeptide repeat protein [Brevundimonas sp.]